MKKKNKYILFTGIVTLLVVLVLESYLRFHESYVIMQKQDWLNKLGIVKHNPEYLIHYTNRGRRLVPGADVIIKKHKLSGRDIPMQINALGFRDEEIDLEKPT